MIPNKHEEVSYEENRHRYIVAYQLERKRSLSGTNTTTLDSGYTLSSRQEFSSIIKD
jgi:hypothetical protein